MDTYEVLVIERDDDGNGYYIRYYPDGNECKGINMRLDDEQFEVFCRGKFEV